MVRGDPVITSDQSTPGLPLVDDCVPVSAQVDPLDDESIAVCTDGHAPFVRCRHIFVYVAELLEGHLVRELDVNINLRFVVAKSECQVNARFLRVGEATDVGIPHVCNQRLIGGHDVARDVGGRGSAHVQASFRYVARTFRAICYIFIISRKYRFVNLKSICDICKKVTITPCIIVRIRA